MAMTAYSRGHLCEYLNKKWVYCDNGESIGDEVRACQRCGEMPTLEGYDACLGYIEGAGSVCCGHGVNPPMIMWEG